MLLEEWDFLWYKKGSLQNKQSNPQILITTYEEYLTMSRPESVFSPSPPTHWLLYIFSPAKYDNIWTKSVLPYRIFAQPSSGSISWGQDEINEYEMPKHLCQVNYAFN